MQSTLPLIHRHNWKKMLIFWMFFDWVRIGICYPLSESECFICMKFFYWCEQEIARELAEKNPVAPNGVMFLQNRSSESVEMSSSVPLLARVHLKLGAWRWHLNPSLDEESVRGNCFLPLSHSIHNIGNHQLLSLDILENLYLQHPFMCCRILTHCREELSLQLVGSFFILLFLKF